MRKYNQTPLTEPTSSNDSNRSFSSGPLEVTIFPILSSTNVYQIQYFFLFTISYRRYGKVNVELAFEDATKFISIVKRKFRPKIGRQKLKGALFLLTRLTNDHEMHLSK